MYKKYPFLQASKKGTKSAVVGVIFAVFPLVIILLSPLIGLLVSAELFPFN